MLRVKSVVLKIKGIPIGQAEVALPEGDGALPYLRNVTFWTAPQNMKNLELVFDEEDGEATHDSE